MYIADTQGEYCYSAFSFADIVSEPEINYAPGLLEVTFVVPDDHVLLQNFDRQNQSYIDLKGMLNSSLSTDMYAEETVQAQTTLNAYLHVAAEIYGVDYIQNITSFWRQYDADINPNVYYIKTPNHIDSLFMKQDLERMDGFVKEVRREVAMQEFVVPNDPMESDLWHLRQYP